MQDLKHTNSSTGIVLFHHNTQRILNLVFGLKISAQGAPNSMQPDAKDSNPLGLFGRLFHWHKPVQRYT